MSKPDPTAQVPRPPLMPQDGHHRGQAGWLRKRFPALLSLAGALYYASYLTQFPFGFGDEGYLFYVADALAHGQRPYTDIRLFAYLPGLFYLFGPLVTQGTHEIFLARSLMAVGLVLKANLMYACARRLAGWNAAVAVALATLLVPGRWHKFYVGLTALWVVYALITYLQRPGVKAAAGMGLALGVALVLRIDVALASAGLLVWVLASQAHCARQVGASLGRLEWLAAPAVAALVTLPVMARLASDGVWLAHLHQWAGVVGLAARRAAPGARLPGPSLEAVVSFGPEGASALLYYASLLVVGVAVSVFLVVSRSRDELGLLPRAGPARGTVLAVVGLWALTAVPQYAYERPDPAHLTQQAFCFLLPGAMLATWAAGSAGRARRAWQRRLAAGAVLTLAVLVVSFVGKHVWFGEGGSIGVLRWPAHRVVLTNGFVYPADRAEPYRPLLEAVIQGSAPEDRIAALPFAPGVAFAARRRLPRPEVYLVPHSMTTPDIEARYLQSLRSDPPRFVVYEPRASFNGSAGGRLAGFAPGVDAHLRESFRIVLTRGGRQLLEPARQNEPRSGR